MVNQGDRVRQGEEWGCRVQPTSGEPEGFCTGWTWTPRVLLYSKDRDVAAHVQGLFRCVRAGTTTIYSSAIFLNPRARARPYTQGEESEQKCLCICCGDPPPHFVVDTALERMEDHEVAMRWCLATGRPLPVQAQQDLLSRWQGEQHRRSPSRIGDLQRRRRPNPPLPALSRSPKGPQSPSEHGPQSSTQADFAKVGLDRGACASFCLICAIPLTGRTHQIRLHVASAGFPIVGDPLCTALSDELMPRQALLHAFKLTLRRFARGGVSAGHRFPRRCRGRVGAAAWGGLGWNASRWRRSTRCVRAAPFQEGEGKS